MNEQNRSGGIVIRKKHIIIAVVLILLLIAGGIFAGLNWDNWFDGAAGTANTSTTGNENPDIDPGAADWTGEKPQEQSKDQSGTSSGIAIPGYPEINIPANTKNIRVALLNPEGNPCYFTFELILKGSGESLYKSKLVPPGKAVTDLTLSRGLAPGEYDAVIKITTNSLTDQSAMNGANVETVLIVQ